MYAIGFTLFLHWGRDRCTQVNLLRWTALWYFPRVIFGASFFLYTGHGCRTAPVASAHVNWWTQWFLSLSDSSGSTSTLPGVSRNGFSQLVFCSWCCRGHCRASLYALGLKRLWVKADIIYTILDLEMFERLLFTRFVSCKAAAVKV